MRKYELFPYIFYRHFLDEHNQLIIVAITKMAHKLQIVNYKL